MVKTNGFDRFMTSECTERLILAFSSKTGQSEAHTRHKFLKEIFLSDKEYIHAFYRL